MYAARRQAALPHRHTAAVIRCLPLQQVELSLLQTRLLQACRAHAGAVPEQRDRWPTRRRHPDKPAAVSGAVPGTVPAVVVADVAASMAAVSDG